RRLKHSLLVFLRENRWKCATPDSIAEYGSLKDDTDSPAGLNPGKNPGSSLIWLLKINSWMELRLVVPSTVAIGIAEQGCCLAHR
ncbi:MAG: hypothetical protein K4571_10110, partial [Deltaproteobacteria bacterium]